MKVYVNNTEHNVPAGTTVSGLLECMEIRNLKGTALAVNGEIIPGDQWQHTEVNDQDRVLMIEAVQGG